MDVEGFWHGQGGFFPAFADASETAAVFILRLSERAIELTATLLTERLVLGLWAYSFTSVFMGR